MNKTRINFWLDLVSFVLMLALAGTGLVIKYVLPPGQGRRGGGYETLMGLTRHDIGAVHYYIAILLLAAVAVHVALHWRWIVCRFKELGKAKPSEEHCEPRKGD